MRPGYRPAGLVLRERRFMATVIFLIVSAGVFPRKVTTLPTDRRVIKLGHLFLMGENRGKVKECKIFTGVIPAYLGDMMK